MSADAAAGGPPPSHSPGRVAVSSREDEGTGKSGRGLRQRFREELWDRSADHLPALDGLRAIAALLIVAFHCFERWLTHGTGLNPWLLCLLTLPPWLYRSLFQTWVGVDIFFVLSGFLIGRILFRQIEQGGVDFRGFYLRRTFRIVPIYWIVLTFSVLVGTRIESFTGLYDGATPMEIASRSWANFLFVSNYAWGLHTGNAMSWGWSLCVEEQFYLLFPLLLTVWFAAGGRGRPLLTFVVLLLLAGVPTLVRYTSPLRTDAQAIPLTHLYPWTHSHFEGLILGAAVAWAYGALGERLVRIIRPLSPLLWAGSGAAFYWIYLEGGLTKPGTFPMVWQFLVLALGVALLLLSSLDPRNPLSRLLALRFWYPIARVSYGVYLIHFFFVCGIDALWGVPVAGSPTRAMVSFFGFFGLVAVASTLAAIPLFLWVERPLQDGGARLARRGTQRALPDKS